MTGKTEEGREVHSRYRRLWTYSVIFTAFVSLTPLVVMTLTNFYQYEKMFEAEMTHQISRLTSNSKRFMGDFLEERRAALTYVASRERFETLSDPDELNRIFLDMKESFGGFVDLGVFDADGNQRSYAGPYELAGRSYKGQDWFHQVYARGVYVSDVFMGYRNSPHFVIAVRLDGSGTEGSHFLRATIDTEILNRYIASLDLQASSDVFLINREGILQTPSRHEGAVLDPCSIAIPPFSPKTEVLEVTNNRGDAVVLGYAYVEHAPFIFAVLARPGDITQSWLRLRSYVLLLLGISVIGIMAVILWSSTSLVNRIREADYRRNDMLHKVEYTNKMATIGRVAAGMAHEINNPLAIINENTGLMKDLLSMGDSPPDVKRLLKIVDAVLRSVERCSTITHRMLGFAKRMDPETERIALGPLLEEVMSFQGKEAVYRSISVNLDVPSDLPMIDSDRGQLQQVFLNILSNAYAAVEDGGRIDISLTQEDEALAVTISDNGPGIPQEHMRRIFEPFFSTRADYGTGLGLSITFGIVEKLGGQLDVKNNESGGASFTVRLPVTQRS